jgi:hypothetical protein
MTQEKIIEIPDLYRILPMVSFRATDGVSFDYLTPGSFPGIDSIDRVIHTNGATSPGSVGDVEKAWYMHPHQDDNLMVLHGTRFVELYTKAHGQVLKFAVTPEKIMLDGEKINKGPAILTWPKNVFHRVISGEQGSASINFATHYEGFDLKTNFNIYDLNTATGEHKILRVGELDQF